MDLSRAPFDDPSVSALADAERAAITAHWVRRVRSELRVGRTFAAMVPLLRDRGASAPVLELLASSALEEEEHAALCLRLAEAYAGTSLSPPLVGDVPVPRFGVGDEDLECALLVAGMCCVNETIATAWLSACLDAATAPLAVFANRVHLADEIDHARLGWAHLASSAVAPETREALGECLPKLLEANVPLWERDDPAIPREGIASHGQLAAEASREVIRRAVTELVIPGFAHVGVDTMRAVAWLEARAG